MPVVRVCGVCVVRTWHLKVFFFCTWRLKFFLFLHTWRLKVFEIRAQTVRNSDRNSRKSMLIVYMYGFSIDSEKTVEYVWYMRISDRNSGKSITEIPKNQ